MEADEELRACVKQEAGWINDVELGSVSGMEMKSMVLTYSCRHRH